jgi:hypothetical protein
MAAVRWPSSCTGLEASTDLGNHSRAHMPLEAAKTTGYLWWIVTGSLSMALRPGRCRQRMDSGGTAVSRRGQRLKSASSAHLPSIRASWWPRQKWIPVPNEMCRADRECADPSRHRPAQTGDPAVLAHREGLAVLRNAAGQLAGRRDLSSTDDWETHLHDRAGSSKFCKRFGRIADIPTVTIFRQRPSASTA